MFSFTKFIFVFLLSYFVLLFTSNNAQEHLVLIEYSGYIIHCSLSLFLFFIISFLLFLTYCSFQLGKLITFFKYKKHKKQLSFLMRFIALNTINGFDTIKSNHTFELSNLNSLKSYVLKDINSIYDNKIFKNKLSLLAKSSSNEEVFVFLFYSFLILTKDNTYICNHLQQIIDFYPRKEFTLPMKAELLYRNAKFREALLFLNYMSSKVSNDFISARDNLKYKCYVSISKNYYNNKDYTKALKYIDFSFSVNNKFGHHVLLKAKILFHLVKIRKLKSYIEEIFVIFPCVELVDLYLDTIVKKEDKLKFIRKITSKNIEHEISLYILSRELISLRMYDSVIELLEPIINNIKSPAVHGFLFISIIEVGDRHKILSVLNKFAKKFQPTISIPDIDNM